MANKSAIVNLLPDGALTVTSSSRTGDTILLPGDLTWRWVFCVALVPVNGGSALNTCTPYLQTSRDGGSTWADVAYGRTSDGDAPSYFSFVAQFGAALDQGVAVTTDASTARAAGTQAALVSAFLGNRVRVKCALSSGDSSLSWSVTKALLARY